MKKQGWLRMEKIDTDYKRKTSQILAKLFKPAKFKGKALFQFIIVKTYDEIAGSDIEVFHFQNNTVSDFTWPNRKRIKMSKLT